MKKKSYYILVLVTITVLSIVSCGKKDDTIEFASKPMTEQYIMSSMFKQYVEDKTDLKVNITDGVGGGTSNIAPAMKKGEFDAYLEYTGTGWNQVLKENSIFKENMFSELQKKYSKMGQSWNGMLGFNNTFGIAVSKDIAKKYNLKTYSDLAKVSKELRLGAEYDFFEREDGYKALKDKYGMNFKETSDLEQGLKYKAIKEKKVDVINIFTTDGKLTSSDVVVLKDDLGLYPSYKCGFVVRNEIIKKYPQLKDVFKKLENTVTDSEMSKMNYEVEVEKKSPKKVAKNFLVSKGLIK